MIQLKKILNQNPKLIKGYHLLALIYLKKEEYEKARRNSEKSGEESIRQTPQHCAFCGK